MTDPRVFLSYDRTDQAVAEQVRARLLVHDVKTWMDRYDIPAGAYWPDEIDAALSQATHVVGLLSPEAVASRNVKNEWDWAIQNATPLILLRIRPGLIPHRYVAINYIDATKSGLDKALDELMRIPGLRATPRLRAAPRTQYAQNDDLDIAFPDADRSRGNRQSLVREYPSGTVTFLFTDVEGSTRRWEEDSPAMLAAIERHFALLDVAIAANSGVRFKTIGDAIQAAFPTALDAVQAAVAAQRVLAAEDWGALGPIQVRMAVHTGAATPRDGDYLAPSLNRLARLLSAGYGGQILATEATRNLVRELLPPDVQLRDLGEQRLRDLREAEHVYQIFAAGLETDFPPLKSLSRPAHNLPDQLTSFIGREQEVAEVQRWLKEPGVRLLTLTGPGGTGKTRLSLQAAADLVADYADGVWFVPLAPITNASKIATAIAEALHVRETAGESVEESLRGFLGSRQLLLVLDNVEHVVAGAPLLAELLAAAPSLQILATSRSPLRISGEHELPISPMELPRDQDFASPEAALTSDAVRLFVERARAVRPDFALTAANAATVAAICRQLDGLPLAIELAAARIRLLPPDAILQRLNSRLTLLTGGGRDRPERQQTLRAAVAWSHDLLDAEEQALFRRLAVFAGGWTLEAAEAIATASEPAVSAVDCLSSLHDNSLIRPNNLDAQDGSGELRFTMLQTIREFAAEQLAASGELGAIRSTHAQWFAGLAADAKPHLNGPSAVAWLDRLDADHDNLRAALDWLRDQGDAAAAIRLTASLWRFWWLRGHISEGRQHLSEALALGVSGDAAAERAEALDGAGVLAETQNDYDQAETMHRQAVALSRNLGDQRGTARSLDNLGVVAFDRGDHEHAIALLEESLDLARAGDDHHLVATALNDLGRVAYARGELHRAESLYQESLALRRREGSGSEMARSLNNLGFVAFDLGEFSRARRLFEESLDLYRAAGDKWGAAGPLYGLAAAIQREGDQIRAVSLLEESLSLFLETGDPRNASLARLDLADAAREAGDLRQAASYFYDALIGFQGVGERAGVVESLLGLGGILARQGKPEAAARTLGAASALAESPDHPQAMAEGGRYQDDLAAVRAALGEESFTVAWEAGRTMSTAAAIARAREDSQG